MSILPKAVEDDLDNKPDMLQPRGVQHLAMADQNYSSGYVFQFFWHNILRDSDSDILIIKCGGTFKIYFITCWIN